MTPTYDNMSREERRTLHGVVISVIAGQLLAPFMHSGVAVMLPSIARELHASGAQLGLVGTVYCLALAIFHLVMGRAGDQWGRKRVCLCGMLLLTSAVTATVFCPGIETVIGLRFLQGMGTATVNTCALTMMVACSPPNLRGRIFGLTMTSVYLGLAVGPVVGGYMDTTFGWRSLFGVLGGVGAFSCIVMSVFVRREWKEKPEAPYDWTGLCLFAGGMTAFVMGTVGPVPPAVAPFCAGAGLLGIVLFGMHQTRLTSTEPLLDVKHLLHNRVFVLSNIASLAMFSSLFAITFFFSLYLQYVKGYSARDAGFVLFAEPLAQLAFTAIAGVMADKHGAERIALIGAGVGAVSLGLGTFLDAGSALWQLYLILCLNGLSIALFSAPNTVVIMGSVAPQHMSQASGLVGTVRTMGMLCSMMIATGLVRWHIGDAPISSGNIPDLLAAMHQAFFMFAAMCTISILCSVGRMKR